MQLSSVYLEMTHQISFNESFSNFFQINYTGFLSKQSRRESLNAFGDILSDNKFLGAPNI